MQGKKLSAAMIVCFAVVLLASPTFSRGQSAEPQSGGKYYNETMVWYGVTRYYRVYVPVGLPASPPLLVMLHATSFNSASQPPTSKNYGWAPLAQEHKFILVQPASTFNSQSGQWNWNAYYLDPAFTQAEIGACTVPPATDCPDDAGFLRQLITNLTAQYNIDPKQVFVAGMSSGAMMAQRVGVELSDIVAAIGPTSGQIVGQPTLPITLPGPPVAPVSVQEWHGTKDRVLQPCNNGPTLYSGYQVLMATVDDSFNYWVSQNACTHLQTSQPLCENQKPNPNVKGNDATACTDNVEVQFIWESNLGHTWVSSSDEARWQFFAAHPKP